MPDSTTVLVTGGAGFIGSHTCVDLLQHGYEVVVVDDHSNSSPAALDRVETIAGRGVTAYGLDLRDATGLADVFSRHRVDAVIHFAAKKAVGESVDIPLDYYDVNVSATVGLLRAMLAHGVHRLVFSSSCSIYGSAERVPIVEDDPARPTNPYARTKWMCEQILQDVCYRHPELRVLALRYFNPVGAHESGLLGEDPRGVPNNLMPYLAQIAVGRLPRLSVFGADYPTPDGTGIRDYIHVMDVADGHRVALEHLDDDAGVRVLNLGTGVGTSVIELVEAFEAASGRPIPYDVVPRRPGDVAALVADPARAEREWDWLTQRSVEAMCRDAWRFQQRHPVGYSG